MAGAGAFYLGFGFTSHIDVDKALGFMADYLEHGGYQPIIGLATIDRPLPPLLEQGLQQLFARPIHKFSVAALERQTPHLATPSAQLFKRIGCHSVCEAAALALIVHEGNGAVGHVQVPKVNSGFGLTFALTRFCDA